MSDLGPKQRLKDLDAQLALTLAAAGDRRRGRRRRQCRPVRCDGCARRVGAVRSCRSSRYRSCAKAWSPRAALDALWEVAPAMAMGAATGEVTLEVSAESDMSSTPGAVAAAARHLAQPRRWCGGSSCRSAGSTRSTLSSTGRGGGCSSRSTSREPSPPCWPGWTGLWARVQGLQLELALLPLYDGEVPWLDLIGDLAMRGFAPYLLFPGYFSRALGRQVQLDAVFYRA